MDSSSGDRCFIRVIVIATSLVIDHLRSGISRWLSGSASGYMALYCVLSPDRDILTYTNIHRKDTYIIACVLCNGISVLECLNRLCSVNLYLQVLLIDNNNFEVLMTSMECP